MITNLRVFQEVLKRNNLPTPDTYLGISELIRSLYRPDVTPNPERIREVLEELTWPVTVPAGNPITFKSCSEVLASEALVTISPKQSGTGDPSPENVRPISGWDGLVLDVSGKNLLEKPFVYNDNVTTDLSNYFLIRRGQYTFSFGSITATNWRFVFRLKDKNGNVLSDNAHLPLPSGFSYNSSRSGYMSNTNVTSKSIVLDIVEDCYIRILFALGDTTASTTATSCQLEIGSTATTYEPYQGQTHTATFSNTVCGGSYDFVSGSGSSEWRKITINAYDSNFNDYDRLVRTDTVRVELRLGSYPIKTHTYAEGADYIKCNILPTTGSSAWSTSNDFINISSLTGYDTLLIMSLPVSIYGTTPEEINTALGENPIEVAYKLATPTSITITPEDIELLKGANTIWTDGDTVQIKFQILK